MKILNFFISIFRGIFQNFHFPLMVWSKFFNLQNWFFSIFSFPSGGMVKFFKIQKQKFSIQISRTKKFKFFNFKKFSLWHKWFISRPEVAKFVKNCKNYLFILTKNSHILHISGMVYRKRAQLAMGHWKIIRCALLISAHSLQFIGPCHFFFNWDASTWKSVSLMSLYIFISS
jgi:hypothetical protein